jgi:DNA-binding response OmpR family regulator
MKFAMLMADATAQARIALALAGNGIEAVPFDSADALVAAQAAQAFAAILVEDAVPNGDDPLGHLLPHLAAQTALIVIGAGGAASMSRALLRGADDYAINCEPAAEHLVQRVIARTRVKLRTARNSVLTLGAYTLDLAQSALWSPGRQAQLTARELSLARLLFEQRNQLVPNDQLCRALCGRVDAAAVRAVKQHAYELRRKLRLVTPEGGPALRIETVYGQGYRLAG